MGKGEEQGEDGGSVHLCWPGRQARTPVGEARNRGAALTKSKSMGCAGMVRPSNPQDSICHPAAHVCVCAHRSRGT